MRMICACTVTVLTYHCRDTIITGLAYWLVWFLNNKGLRHNHKDVKTTTAGGAKTQILIYTPTGRHRFMGVCVWWSAKNRGYRSVSDTHSLVRQAASRGKAFRQKEAASPLSSHVSALGLQIKPGGLRFQKLCEGRNKGKTWRQGQRGFQQEGGHAPYGLKAYNVLLYVVKPLNSHTSSTIVSSLFYNIIKNSHINIFVMYDYIKLNLFSSCSPVRKRNACKSFFFSFINNTKPNWVLYFTTCTSHVYVSFTLWERKRWRWGKLFQQTLLIIGCCCYLQDSKYP